jgi:hypothetical protein
LRNDCALASKCKNGHSSKKKEVCFRKKLTENHARLCVYILVNQESVLILIIVLGIDWRERIGRTCNDAFGKKI